MGCLALQVVCAKAGKDLLVQIRHRHTGEDSLGPEIERLHLSSVIRTYSPVAVCGSYPIGKDLFICCNHAGLDSSRRHRGEMNTLLVCKGHSVGHAANHCLGSWIFLWHAVFTHFSQHPPAQPQWLNDVSVT